MHTCMQLNISTCLYTEDKDFVLAIYNPLSQKVVSPIRVPVQNGEYNVIDLTGTRFTISGSPESPVHLLTHRVHKPLLRNNDKELCKTFS